MKLALPSVVTHLRSVDHTLIRYEAKVMPSPPQLALIRSAKSKL
jgi:hypothetical protein